MKKKILILSDTHCGHKWGLAHQSDCVNKEQRRAWRHFREGIQKYKPFDAVFVNGDAIEGNSKKNGGVELITTDRLEQSNMAMRVLNYVRDSSPKSHWAFTRGTPYHTGNEEDFEDIIAKEFGAKIDDSLLVRIGGVTFDLKHKVGSASLPHGRSSSPARDVVLSMLKEVKEGRPKADVFLRSHVHYYSLVEVMNRIAITTPALQINSGYGQRQCSGMTDWGFLVCEVENGNVLRWIKCIESTPIKPEKVLEL